MKLVLPVSDSLVALWLLPGSAERTRILTRDTDDGYASWVIALRFQVRSEQARAVSLAMTVRVATPADLLRRRTREALAPCLLAQVYRRDRYK